MSRVLLILEILFWASFWLQTRINLREWWPNWFTVPLNSDYLIPFIYLSDILLVLLLTLWLVERGFRLQISGFRKKAIHAWHLAPETWYLIPNALMKSTFLWLSLFVLSALVSVIINGGEWWSWYGWWRILEGVGLSIYIYHRWQKANVRQYALGVLLLGLLGESVMLIGEWLKQASLGWQWVGEWSFTVYTPGIAKIIVNGQEYLRPYATFAHPNVAAAILLLSLIVVGWWLLNRLQSRPQQLAKSINQDLNGLLPGQIKSLYQPTGWSGVCLLIMSSSLLLAGLFITFSRAAWVIGVVCIGLLLIWFGRSVHKLLASPTSRIILIIGVTLVVAISGPIVWSRFSSLDGTDRLSIERRIQLNDVALNLLSQQQWLGVGPNNFIIHLANFGPLYGIGIWREPVHNLYLLIAVETGLVGLTLWATAHVVIWTRLGLRIKRGRANSNLLLVVILWLALVLLGLIDHYWWTSQPGRLAWWIVVGASLALLKNSEGRE